MKRSMKLLIKHTVNRRLAHSHLSSGHRRPNEPKERPEEGKAGHGFCCCLPAWIRCRQSSLKSVPVPLFDCSFVGNTWTTTNSTWISIRNGAKSTCGTCPLDNMGQETSETSFEFYYCKHIHQSILLIWKEMSEIVSDYIIYWFLQFFGTSYKLSILSFSRNFITNE